MIQLFGDAIVFELVMWIIDRYDFSVCEKKLTRKTTNAHTNTNTHTCVRLRDKMELVIWQFAWKVGTINN